MPVIESLFKPHTARSVSFEDHRPGPVAYVTNGLRDNGVLGFVTPLSGDRVFEFTGLTVSAFCEATVQMPPFIARGNGGSGLIVLEPKMPMTPTRIGYIAACINTTLHWRFSWYRQASVQRIRRLEIPDVPASSAKFRVKNLLPQTSKPVTPYPKLRFRPFRLDAIYDLVPGEYHNASRLPRGAVPLVSCGDADNGIIRFVDVPEDRIHQHKLTIALNGATLTGKYHPYKFAAKDDIAVCSPRTPLRLSTEIFIQMTLNRERWRYSYYRKCFIEKLRRFQLSLPVSGEHIDEDGIQTAIEATAYWRFLKSGLENRAGLTLRTDFAF